MANVCAEKSVQSIEKYTIFFEHYQFNTWATIHLNPHYNLPVPLNWQNTNEACPDR